MSVETTVPKTLHYFVFTAVDIVVLHEYNIKKLRLTFNNTELDCFRFS